MHTRTMVCKCKEMKADKVAGDGVVGGKLLPTHVQKTAKQVGAFFWSAGGSSALPHGWPFACRPNVNLGSLFHSSNSLWIFGKGKE
jgi:hypothetical protein